MYKIVVTTFLSFLFFTGAFAQTSFGFRTGLSFASFEGELEPGETYESDNGFHIGLGFSRNFTDIWGVRGELVYSQKGGLIKYDGDSFLTLNRGDRKINTLGNRNMTLSVNNTHIDLPITGFGRLTNWFEITAGIVPNFLVSSRATGDLTFVSDALVDDVALSLDYDFYGNEAGQVNASSTNIEVKERATANTLTIPSMPGAYYFQETKDGSQYNVFGLDALAGIAFYLNGGLFVSAKVQYGLLDITNNSADFSLAEKDVLRTDKDVNITYQASVGFYF